MFSAHSFRILFLCISVLLVSCKEQRNQIPPNQSNEAVSQEKFPLNNRLVWHWENDFDIKQKEIHKRWVSDIFDASQAVLGTYIYPKINIHFHLSSNPNKPVSFGYASRKKGAAVHLYVRAKNELSELMEDWVAPHEISHLSMPFIGKGDTWFNEGIATYLSRQILVHLGSMSQKEFDEHYRTKFLKFEAFNNATMSFVNVCDSLLDSNNYGAVYSGGAGYFLLLDFELRKKNTRFTDIVKKYQQQNRKADRTMEDIVHSFDQLIGENLASQLLTDFQTLPSSAVTERIRSN